MSTTTTEQDVERAVRGWDEAMVTNDAAAIGEYMADDWSITGPDGVTTVKEAFLASIRTGALTHHTMESNELRIRVFGDDAAVVTSQGISGGKYLGQAFRELEKASNFFVKQNGAWRCVLTHLSKIAR